MSDIEELSKKIEELLSCVNEVVVSENEEGKKLLLASFEDNEFENKFVSILKKRGALGSLIALTSFIEQKGVSSMDSVMTVFRFGVYMGFKALSIPDLSESFDSVNDVLSKLRKDDSVD